MKLIKYFDAFLENTVNLNPARMDLLDTRTTAIENFLRQDEVFGPLLKATIPQGSFAQKTIIRPRADGTFDADMLVHLDPMPDWAACEYVGKLYTALGQQRAPRLTPLPLEYADFAAWQRTPAAAEREAPHLEYWKRQLAGAPVERHERRAVDAQRHRRRLAGALGILEERKVRQAVAGSQCQRAADLARPAGVRPDRPLRRHPQIARRDGVRRLRRSAAAGRFPAAAH